ncbi:jun-like transcription factor [Cladophialophora chaetospira]|uniref:Jun-like transcription factor n=1 Tax=Cladophialophora chaetospira TaxID=386627 RepID=A0AA38WXK7_9EURO|nr:jun-like transcription factor [Cladophialophora chaetospira]
MSVHAEPAQVAPEPSSQVLSLVSAFLSTHGFDSTSKALKKELKRKTFVTDLEPLESGIGLESIVESWNIQQAQSSSEDQSAGESEAATSGSESESSSATSSEAGHDSAPSDAASSSSSDSDSEEEEKVPPKPTKSKKAKRSKREVSPAVSSSSSSDSDADDENEDVSKVETIRKKSPTSSRKTDSVPSLKRKAASSSADSSSSDSDSDDDGERPVKRIKHAIDVKTSSSEASSSEPEDEASESDASSTKSGTNASSDTDTSSSEEEQDDDDNGEEESAPAQPRSFAKLMKETKEAKEAPSDSSSNTVMGDVVDPEENSAEAEESRSADNKSKTQALTKKKHVGARPTPLAQLSAQASVDAHISNAYKSYEYADRAYNDLSVTRGKGFTKEKNKKKRGSYRGGAIDTSGGKSFKFDD